MKWLLDTNVISETARSSPNRTVMQVLLGVSAGSTLAISMLTLAELNVRYSLDAASGSAGTDLKSAWIDGEVERTFGGRISAGHTSIS